MKVEDAVASAMDWLAQLREEGHDEPSYDAGDMPPAVAAPPAGATSPAPPAPPVAPPAAAIPRARVEPPVAATPPVAAVAPLVAPPAAAIPRARVEPPVAATPPVAAVAPLAAAIPPAVAAPSTAAPPAAATPPMVAVPPSVAVPPLAAAIPPAVVAPPVAAMPPAVAVPPPANETSRRTGIRTRVEITERAAIGDELRIPIAWCEMGSCISHYADPAALGEADIRARAIAAGWRLDALSRLACPQCQQNDSWFWTAHPVALWDRDTAVAMTTLMAEAVRVAATADAIPGADTPASLRTEPALPPLPALPVRGRHRQHPDHPDRVTGESRGNGPTG
jgi:hypothetical protein